MTKSKLMIWFRVRSGRQIWIDLVGCNLAWCPNWSVQMITICSCQFPKCCIKLNGFRKRRIDGFLHFNYDFFLEIMFLLMVSVYNFKAFSNHQTLTPICPFPRPGSQEVSLGRPRNVYSASGTGAHLPGDPSWPKSTLWTYIVSDRCCQEKTFTCGHCSLHTICEWPNGERTVTKKTVCISMVQRLNDRCEF